MESESTPPSGPDTKTSENQEQPPCVEESKVANEDSELDDLLDSALEDFNKPPISSSAASKTDLEGTVAATDQQAAVTNHDSSSDHGNAPGAAAASQSEQEKLFDQIFSGIQMGPDQSDAQAQFGDMMKALLSEEPQMADQFRNLTEALDKAETDPERSQEMLQDTLHQTMGSLAQNAQDIQSGMGEDDLMRMMSQMNFDGDGEGGGDDAILPMMQGMMKSLLSKDVLYPSLKEITAKYPTWLTENKEKLETAAFNIYTKQYELMETICKEFESEHSSDSQQQKQQRFDKIMNLMQDMQGYGQPPKDIVGEMAPGLEFDASGAPKFPGSPDQCHIM